MGCIENDTHNNSSIVACASAAAVTLIPSRCLTSIGYTHVDTQTDGFVNYAVEMCSGAKFHKDCFGYSKVDGAGTQSHIITITQAYSCFVLNKEKC
jgi:hypothetical protein